MPRAWTIKISRGMHNVDGLEAGDEMPRGCSFDNTRGIDTDASRQFIIKRSLGIGKVSTNTLLVRPKNHMCVPPLAPVLLYTR
jgi:hypothetical protein